MLLFFAADACFSFLLALSRAMRQVAATKAYVDFLGDVADTKDVVACAAAMVRRMRIQASPHH